MRPESLRLDGPRAPGLSLAALIVALGTMPASAWQGPLSEQELAARSEVVAVADIVGVACVGFQAESRPRYRAWAIVVTSEKGPEAPHSTIQVEWTAANPELAGSWEARLYAGERAKLFLVRGKTPGAWKVVHRDGAVTLRGVARTARVLPEAPGEVVLRGAGPDRGRDPGPAEPPPTGPNPGAGSKPSAAPMPPLERPDQADGRPPAPVERLSRRLPTRPDALFPLSKERMTMLRKALIVALIASGATLAPAQEAPVPAPQNTKTKTKPNPSQQTTVIGTIQKIDMKQQIIIIKPKAGQAIQSQQVAPKPIKGSKDLGEEFVTVAIGDETEIELPGSKSTPDDTSRGVHTMRALPANSATLASTTGLASTAPAPPAPPAPVPSDETRPTPVPADPTPVPKDDPKDKPAPPAKPDQDDPTPAPPNQSGKLDPKDKPAPPAKPDQDDPKPAPPTQSGKLGPKDKPAPPKQPDKTKARPVQSQFSQLKVNQLVQVQQFRQDDKTQTLKIRVIAAAPAGDPEN